MNKVSTSSRVNYFEKQYLRRQEFSDEQAYHLAMRRRHNIAHHTWGIVVGLELVAEDGSLIVRPGMAIDGYGRELFLPAKFGIKTGEFSRLGSNRLDVWLGYRKSNSLKPPPGFVECNLNDNGDNYLRINETPLIYLERARASRIEARRPKGVPSVLLDSNSQLQTTDDDLTVWPIYLGRITYVPEETDPAKRFLIDVSDRPYAGIVAEVIEHPQNATRVEVGKKSESDEKQVVGDATAVYKAKSNRAFAVFVPGATAPPPNTLFDLEPRFEIDVDDNNILRGTTTLNGNLLLAKGIVQFTEPEIVVEEVERSLPAIYRCKGTDKNHDDKGQTDKPFDELRIDLGQLREVGRIFQIGHTTEDGSFRAALKLEFKKPIGGTEAQPLLTIYGDLKLDGLINSRGTKERTLAEETLNALLASFQAGMSAAQSG